MRTVNNYYKTYNFSFLHTRVHKSIEARDGYILNSQRTIALRIAHILYCVVLYIIV